MVTILQKGQTTLLERVQHHLRDLKSLENEERLKVLGTWSLDERRNRGDLLDLLEVFKMKSGLSARVAVGIGFQSPYPSHTHSNIPWESPYPQNPEIFHTYTPEPASFC